MAKDKTFLNQIYIAKDQNKSKLILLECDVCRENISLPMNIIEKSTIPVNRYPNFKTGYGLFVTYLNLHKNYFSILS